MTEPKQEFVQHADLDISSLLARYERQIGALTGKLILAEAQGEADAVAWHERERGYRETLDVLAARVAELEGTAAEGEGGDEPGSSKRRTR